MIVNNWNTFYFAYQAVFGFASIIVHTVAHPSLTLCSREIFLYFLTFYFFIVVVTYSLLVSLFFSLPNLVLVFLLFVLIFSDLQVSFVMEAFFLHYNSKKAPSEDSPEEDSGLALSEKLRIERQLAFAVV
jgi:hypothetical protein